LANKLLYEGCSIQCGTPKEEGKQRRCVLSGSEQTNLVLAFGATLVFSVGLHATLLEL